MSTVPPDSSRCRILTVSTTLDRAVALVARIQGLNSPPAPPPAPENPSLGASTRIPWTLSNKYYTAEVHFAVHTVTGLSPHAVHEAPAVVFVWGKGAAYKEYIARLAGDMRGAEPEVALAVRVKAEDSEDDAEEEAEEDADVDAFLSEHGFEFVDVSEEESSREDGGLPRVLDALSTIMWPSMVASSSSKNRSKRDWEWARGSSSDNDEDPNPLTGEQFQSRRDEEMKELTRWLENDDPWRSAADSIASPTGVEAPPMEGWSDAKEGFDDDFTVFVSAPPAEENSFDADAWEDEGDGGEGLHAHKLYSYSALGSAQDLREGTEEWAEEDPEMPTDAEIEAMSARIFGEHNMDLTQVMSALEGMKAEIAGMTDEEERKNAAAKVALGLVYGLQE